MEMKTERKELTFKGKPVSIEKPIFLKYNPVPDHPGLKGSEMLSPLTDVLVRPINIDADEVDNGKRGGKFILVLNPERRIVTGALGGFTTSPVNMVSHDYFAKMIIDELGLDQFKRENGESYAQYTSLAIGGGYFALTMNPGEIKLMQGSGSLGNVPSKIVEIVFGMSMEVPGLDHSLRTIVSPTEDYNGYYRSRNRRSSPSSNDIEGFLSENI